MIYLITGIRNLQTNRDGIPYKNKISQIGYYLNKDDAFNRVRGNMADINDGGLYPYVLIQKMDQGFYEDPEETWMFHFNPDNHHYEEIVKPEWFNDQIGFY